MNAISKNYNLLKYRNFFQKFNIFLDRVLADFSRENLNGRGALHKIIYINKMPGKKLQIKMALMIFNAEYFPWPNFNRRLTFPKFFGDIFIFDKYYPNCGLINFC